MGSQPSAAGAAFPEPPVLHIQGFLDAFRRIDQTMQDRAFCFVLGSGASYCSGIKTGGELVRDWLAELQLRDPDHDGLTLDQWATADRLDLQGFELSACGDWYPHIYLRRFRDDPAEGFAYLENVMKDAEPSYGYSVLARVLAETRHRVVITTNFDNLVADALSIYSTQYPVVCGHESLAGFVRAKLRRPLVVKVHNDLLFAPKSMPSEIGKLSDGYTAALTKLLASYTPVVIGYGGNDGSLMGFFEALAPETLEGGMYWCFRKSERLPSENIRRVVARHRGKLVPILGFDELMAMIAELCKYELADAFILNRARDRARKLVETADRLREALQSQQKVSGSGGGHPALEGSEPGEVQAALDALGTSMAAAPEEKRRWWQWRDIAQATEGRAAQDHVYQQGLAALPDDPWMLDAYARFLSRHADTRTRAVEYHGRAVALAPADGSLRGNMANTLARIPGMEHGALTEYRQALALSPDDARKQANFAGFLYVVGDDSQAHALLDAAWIKLSKEAPRSLHVECLFYAYAHRHAIGPETSLRSLKQLVCIDGIRSRHWDFTRNVERAAKDGHPESKWLPMLVDVINERLGAEDLDAWPAWRAIQLNERPRGAR